MLKTCAASRRTLGSVTSNECLGIVVNRREVNRGELTTNELWASTAIAKYKGRTEIIGFIVLYSSYDDVYEMLEHVELYSWKQTDEFRMLQHDFIDIKE